MPAAARPFPHLGLGPRIKHIEREEAQRAHRGTGAQFVDDRECRDFPERRFHPFAVESQFVLAVTLRKFVFRQLVGRQPVQKFRLEDLLAAIKRVTREPDHLLLRQTHRAGMVELFAQRAFVDLLRQLDAGRTVDQRKGGVHIRIELPDHLQHQELVEIRVDQTADDRVEFPGVVINPARDIGLGHACPCPGRSGPAPPISMHMEATADQPPGIFIENAE